MITAPASASAAPAIELHPTACAICGTTGGARELYAANFDLQAFNARIFSARRLPDRVHYRMVRCETCDLVRSDPVIDPQVLATLYEQSSFDYGDEVAGLRRTYRRALKKLDSLGAGKGALLEIGCGNGFLLEEALALGFETVSGVEPSSSACAQAAPSVRDSLKCDLMRPGLFEADSFDVACLFQVFDHIPDPAAMLRECFHVLKPGGLLLFFNHNIEAVSARVLGERSPIIDLEHTFLYSPKTLGRLVEKEGFEVMKSGGAINTYSLHYLVRLVPLPKRLKRNLLARLGRNFLGRIQLLAPLGNLYLVARKPF